MWLKNVGWLLQLCVLASCVSEIDETFIVAPAADDEGRDAEAIALEEYWEQVQAEDADSLATAEVTQAARASQTIDVSTKAQFKSALSSAEAGDTIALDPWAVLDLTGERNLRIAGGVTITGGRSATVPGALLRTLDRGAGWRTWIFLRTAGPDVTVDGVRFEGPDGMITSADSYMGTGIHFGHPRGTVNGCEFYHWPAAGVSVSADDVVVKNNYFHDNIRYGRGYGVVVGGTAIPTIEFNTFDRNRHAIAGSGFGGYILRDNTFLANPYLFYYGWNSFTKTYHRGGMHSQVDMHGAAESLSNPPSNLGGTVIHVHSNRFAIPWGSLTPWDANGNMSIVGIRGVPAEDAIIEDNCAIRNDGGWVGQYAMHRFDRPRGAPWQCYCKGGSTSECNNAAIATAKWLCHIPKFGREMENITVRNNRLGTDDAACRKPVDVALRDRPYRALDTRAGAAPRPQAGATHCFTVAGRGGVPASATTVAINLTATKPATAGFFTAYASGTAKPDTSNLNHRLNQTIANGTFVGVGADKKVCIYSHAAAHMIVDVTAHYSDTEFRSTQVRNIDTRKPTRVGPHSRFAAGATKCVQVRDVGNVPSEARAVAINLVAVNPSDNGFLTVFRSGDDLPVVSNLNYAMSETVGNGAVVTPNSEGDICIYSSAATDVIIDTVGYFGEDSSYRRVTPYRLRDSRTAAHAKMYATGMRCMKVTGHHGVPENARRVSMTLVAMKPSGNGFLTVFPYGQARPNISALNYSPGVVRSNHAMVKTGSGGRICVYSAQETDYLMDIRGYSM